MFAASCVTMHFLSNQNEPVVILPLEGSSHVSPEQYVQWVGLATYKFELLSDYKFLLMACQKQKGSHLKGLCHFILSLFHCLTTGLP